MIPILLTFGPIKIYTFGVFLLLAFFFGCFWLWKLIKLTPYKEEEVFDGLFFSLIGTIFFSRLFFVISNFSDFGFNLLKFILINGYPGMSLYGALIGGILSFFIYCRIKKNNFFELIDYFVIPVFLVLAIGKIGSFFSGVDVGVKTSFPVAVGYFGYSGARHPIALYEAILFFIGFILTHKMIYRIRRDELKSGINFYYFILFFSLVNLIVDKLKQNHIYFFDQSLNILLSYIFGIVGIIYFIIYYRQKIVDKIKLAVRKRK